jgi:hypothetical protein
VGGFVTGRGVLMGTIIRRVGALVGRLLGIGALVEGALVGAGLTGRGVTAGTSEVVGRREVMPGNLTGVGAFVVTVIGTLEGGKAVGGPGTGAADIIPLKKKESGDVLSPAAPPRELLTRTITKF